MDPGTKIDHTRNLRLDKAGVRCWLVALFGAFAVAALLALLAVSAAPARAQDAPGVEAGNGCARAGDVAAGDCDKNSGKDDASGGDASGENTETPDEDPSQPQNGGETNLPEPDLEENTSGTTATTGSKDPDEIMGGTTVTETTGPDLDETTRRALPGFEDTGSTEGGEPASCPVAPPKGAPAATIERAVDGDTVELQESVDGYDRVRLIGVDTPEMGGDDASPEVGAEEAKAFTAEELEGEEVVLETDEEVEDPYGRLLAYVWTAADSEEPQLFNRTLLDEGLAELMIVEPNDAYAECLAAADAPEESTNEDTPDTSGEGTTTGADEGEDQGKNEGLLDRIRNLVSSEEPPKQETTGGEDQYSQDGMTDGPLPEQTQPQQGLQEGTNEDYEPSNSEQTSPEQTSPEQTSSEDRETTDQPMSETPSEPVPPEDGDDYGQGFSADEPPPVALPDESIGDLLEEPADEPSADEPVVNPVAEPVYESDPVPQEAVDNLPTEDNGDGVILPDTGGQRPLFGLAPFDLLSVDAFVVIGGLGGLVVGGLFLLARINGRDS